MDEMKNCPFCDVMDAGIHEPETGGYTVLCRNCTAEGPLHETTAGAIAAWNRRASPAEASEGLELTISDAEIAGVMGWRGPGAYTAASLRKIRKVVECAFAADRARREAEHLDEMSQWARDHGLNVPPEWDTARRAQPAPGAGIDGREGAVQGGVKTAETRMDSGFQPLLTPGAGIDGTEFRRLEAVYARALYAVGDDLTADTDHAVTEARAALIAHIDARIEEARRVERMRQAVASVVSRVGDDLRVGWLRPERCDVGTLLYVATVPINDPKEKDQ